VLPGLFAKSQWLVQHEKAWAEKQAAEKSASAAAPVEKAPAAPPTGPAK